MLATLASESALVQASVSLWLLGLDIAEWTLIVTVLTLVAAIAVVPVQEFLARPKALVGFEPGKWPQAREIVVKLANTGKPTLVFPLPARIVIASQLKADATPIQLPPRGVPHQYPVAIITGDHVLSPIGERELAKQLRNRGCQDWCWIHGEYVDGLERVYRTKKPFLVPLWEWLPADS